MLLSVCLSVCPRHPKSCFAAEVPVQGDEANDKGREILAKLCARDRVLVCGQASSHCVNFSARDLAAAWKRTTAGALEDEISRRRMGSLVLLKDGMSPVAGFEVGGQNCISPACLTSRFSVALHYFYCRCCVCLVVG